MRLKMITCEEASKLISESMDHRIPLLERLNLKFHLMMCKVCPTYLRKLRLLRDLVKNWAARTDKFLTAKNLSPESKTKIKQHLRRFTT